MSSSELHRARRSVQIVGWDQGRAYSVQAECERRACWASKRAVSGIGFSQFQ